MQVESFDIADIKAIRADVSREASGTFSYFYSAKEFEENAIPTGWVQEHSSFYPKKHTVRGLHFQRPPLAQHKFVRVARGRIWDVAVDIRRDSPTFGRHVALELSAENWVQLYVPIGFAHGFCTLEPDTEVMFRITDYNTRGYQGGLLWNDPALGVRWPCGDQPAAIFPADTAWPALRDLDSQF